MYFNKNMNLTNKVFKIYGLLIVIIELFTITIISSISFREMNNIDDCNTDGCIGYSSLVDLFHNNTELIGKCQNLGNDLPSVCEKYAKSYCSSRTYRCPYKKHGETLTDNHKCDTEKCIDCIGCWKGGAYYNCCECKKYEYTYNGFTCYISKWSYAFLILWICISIVWCLMFIIQLFMLSWNNIKSGKIKRINPNTFFFLESIPFTIQTITFTCIYFLIPDFYDEMFDGSMTLIIGLVAILNGVLTVTNILLSIFVKV